MAEARLVLGRDAIVGVSTHTVEEALRAEAEGADYVGFGAMYPTESKAVVHLPARECLPTRGSGCVSPWWQ